MRNEKWGMKNLKGQIGLPTAGGGRGALLLPPYHCHVSPLAIRYMQNMRFTKMRRREMRNGEMEKWRNEKWKMKNPNAQKLKMRNEW